MSERMAIGVGNFSLQDGLIIDVPSRGQHLFLLSAGNGQGHPPAFADAGSWVMGLTWVY